LHFIIVKIVYNKEVSMGLDQYANIRNKKTDWKKVYPQMWDLVKDL